MAAPRRKPRGQPHPPEDVAYNTAFARRRIVVEHSIGRLRRYQAQVAAASWDSVIFDLGRESLVRVPTLEPLRGTKAHVGALLDRSPTAEDLVEALSGG